jgi:hypothetical protein
MSVDKSLLSSLQAITVEMQENQSKFNRFESKHDYLSSTEATHCGVGPSDTPPSSKSASCKRLKELIILSSSLTIASDPFFANSGQQIDQNLCEDEGEEEWNQPELPIIWQREVQSWDFDSCILACHVSDFIQQRIIHKYGTKAFQFSLKDLLISASLIDDLIQSDLFAIFSMLNKQHQLLQAVFPTLEGIIDFHESSTKQEFDRIIETQSQLLKTLSCDSIITSSKN